MSAREELVDGIANALTESFLSIDFEKAFLDEDSGFGPCFMADWEGMTFCCDVAIYGKDCMKPEMLAKVDIIGRADYDWEGEGQAAGPCGEADSIAYFKECFRELAEKVASTLSKEVSEAEEIELLFETGPATGTPGPTL